MNIIYTTGKKTISKKRGVAIIMAIILAAQLLVVGAAIHAISIREQQLSTLADESVRAYAAAESIMECALFQDTRIGNFGTETPIAFYCGTSWNIDGYIPQAENDTDSIIGIPDNECRDYSPTSGDGTCTVFSPTPGLTAVGFSGYPQGSCADVYIAKFVDAAGFVLTGINAHGASSCDPTSRRLERGVAVFYPKP